jgi:CheY-like chemotaxis protein
MQLSGSPGGRAIPPDPRVRSGRPGSAVGETEPGLWLALPPKPVRRCDDQRVSDPVLIVDNDPAFLGLVARILSDLGIESVRTATDATQALLVAEDARPAAVLVDIGLPDRHGADLAYELSDLPWRPRVVLTSSDSEAFLAIGARDGHRELAFIPKEELAEDTLRRALLDG